MRGVPAPPIFDHEIPFVPDEANHSLRAIPPEPGVVALFGHAATDRPFLMQSANLRRRVQRLLEPMEGQTKRLNLRTRVARVAWRTTHSDLEALLLLYRAQALVFGAEGARTRMRLSPPFTVRYAVENRFPRIYVTNHLRRRSLHTTFGPFASRLSAERYREAVEELFVIRRCFMELNPSPDDPGCIYGEMKKCMAPCQARCTDAEYHGEANRALEFLKTGGASLLAELGAERDRASADMEFEQAAAAHARIAKVKPVTQLPDELVRPLDALRLVLLLPHGDRHSDEPQVQVYVFADGTLRGPEVVSLLGVRLAKEQEEVGSSLFAQPMMLAPVPLGGSDEGPTTVATPEERVLAAIARLEDGPGYSSTAELGDHLALLRRWYYRPEKQRAGAAFFREREAWPVRQMVRAAAKLTAPTPPGAPAPQQPADTAQQESTA